MTTILEGIVWTKDEAGAWTKSLENWPSGRRRARIIVDDDRAFGNYSLSEATEIIETAIAVHKTADHYKYSIVPGKETTAEEKQRFVELKKKKQIERGEIEPEAVESYTSTETE